jgi:small subunit ribosomal protein S9
MTLCLRYASRWNPASHPPRRKIPREPLKTLPPDPKDDIPGWPEFKTSLLAKCTNIDEVRLINELTPQEAMLFMNPEAFSAPREDSVKEYLRVLPINRHYFSGQAVIEQRVQDVEDMYEKYKHLPHAPQHLWPLREWEGAKLDRDLDEEAGEYKVGSFKHKYRLRMLTLAKELNKIHPVLMPLELKEWLDGFARLHQTGVAGMRQKRSLDKYSRSKGNGKRKTARAKCSILPGEGLVYVNGKLAADFFTRQKDVENIIWPLQALNALGKYNIWISTFGGGTTGIPTIKIGRLSLGQSEAAKLAVARAMLAHDQSGPQNTFRRILRGGMLALGS